MAQIHPTAIVEKGASIGEDSTIGAYSIIGPHVVIGKNNRIGPHVVIEGNTVIGDGNTIFQFASIGAPPQDLKYRGEESRLEIGNSNLIREFVTLQPGTAGGGMVTKIGDANLFMANSHAGHDGKIGSNNVFANSAALAGHVTVGDYVTIGGMCGIHQFVRLGDHCLLGAGSMVNKDIPPFCIGQGDRAGLAGINVIGLQRRGFSGDDISLLKRLYRDLFWGAGSFNHRVESARREIEDFAPGLAMLKFISESQRGVTTPRSKARSGSSEEERE